MDGLLVDSEPIWREAEITAFGKVGLHMSPETCKQTMGLRIDEVVQYWFKRHPWEGKNLKETEDSILDEFLALIASGVKPMEGVEETLAFLQSKNLPIGLASSSPMRLIEPMVQQLGIRDYFEVLCTAEDEEWGKPHPAVYLRAAKTLGTHPSETLAFEDSFTGLISAIAARMKTVCVPEPSVFGETRFDIATIKLPSLKHFNESVWQQLNEG